MNTINNSYNGEIFKVRYRAIVLKSVFIFLFCLFLSSCRKFVTIDAPISVLVTSSVFNANVTATAAQTSIYAQMSTGALYNMDLITGLSSDELINYSTDLGSAQYYSNAIIPMTERSSDIWAPAYNYIYQANAVIEGISGSNNLTPLIAKQLTAESKFVRAFWLFNLTNIFGDIPLTIKTDYTTNKNISKTKQSLVYQQIIDDLHDAKINLSSNFVDATDTTSTNERVRPTKWAAQALLARVYLYTGDWSNAESEASAVINDKDLFDTVSLNNVFLKNSREAIWQLQSSIPGLNTLEGYSFILTGIPSGFLQNSSACNPNLLNSFEPGDMRKVFWIDSVTISNTTYYYPYKYKVFVSDVVSEYTVILRLAEQYLIRAEARVELGSDINGAISDLNIIRNRAGLPNTGANNKSDILNAIIHERKVELFSENHRWFDLKRRNIVDSVMSIVTPSKNGVWRSSAQLFPISQSEINLAPNLVQNPGYN